MKNLLKLLAIPATLLMVTGCPANKEEDCDEPEDEVWVQIERLGRPGINEALVITNDYLIAFNSIPPSADLSDDAAPVRAEAVAVLNALDSLDGDDDVDPLAIAGAFLPDVLRIETNQSIAVADAAFPAGFPTLPLRGGRKLEDDVIDVYYSVLIGTITGPNPDLGGFVGFVGDGVSYAGPGDGVNAAQPGHRTLYGAADFNSAAEWPFLATPR